MAQYAVYFFCDECSEVHPLGIELGMEDGPVDKASIGDVYAGKDLPPEIAVVAGNKTTCPNTGRLTSQKDNKQVFLVAVG